MESIKRVDVLVYRVGEEPRVESISNELNTFQSVVKGLVEVVWITDDLYLMCNEEGKLEELPPNRIFPLANDVIAGDFFVFKEDSEGEVIDITPTDVEKVNKYFIL